MRGGGVSKIESEYRAGEAGGREKDNEKREGSERVKEREGGRKRHRDCTQI